MENTYLWIRRLNIVMISIPPRNYRFNAILSIYKLAFLEKRIGKAYCKIHMELQSTQNSQNNLEKMNEVGWLTCFLFQNLLQSYSDQDSVTLSQE